MKQSELLFNFINRLQKKGAPFDLYVYVPTYVGMYTGYPWSRRPSDSN